MRKSLTTILAVLLITGVAACNRGNGNDSDADRLNASAAQLDNLGGGVIDTSPDDAALNENQLPADQAGPGNGAAAANSVANATAPAGNRQ
jgi:hypothetical protein